MPSRYSKAFYLENLKMLSDVFLYARKNGLVKLEPDVDEPAKSQLFGKFPKFLKDHHAVHFFCDTLRMAISGGVQPFDLDQMMELDMDVHHHEASAPITALNTMADALPGLELWLRYWELSSPWARWVDHRKRSVTKLPQHWWEPS